MEASSWDALRKQGNCPPPPPPCSAVLSILLWRLCSRCRCLSATDPVGLAAPDAVIDEGCVLRIMGGRAVGRQTCSLLMRSANAGPKRK
jgi:hypothetical protein